MSIHFKHRIARQLALAGLLGTLGLTAQAAADIRIYSRDPAGVGFNDTTPVAPIGGNPGTTLGAQRWNVYAYVASIWAQQLDSTVPISVNAGWEALTCTASSATLGSASASGYWRNFAGAPLRNTWYPRALANKLAGINLVEKNGSDPTLPANMDIKTQFNVNLGKSDCLPSKPFYLGLDNNAPSNATNLMSVLLHELGHGLGFSVATNAQTGKRIASSGVGYPSVWEQFMLDNTTGKTWLNMTDAERAASSVSANLAWTGANVAAATPLVLNAVPIATGLMPASVAGLYKVGTANFGQPLTTNGLTGEVMPLVDQADGNTGLACSTLTAAQASGIRGKLVLIDRGSCSYAIKVKNVQDAGAIGVMIADNADATTPPNMTGVDASISIPTVSLLKADGAKLKTALKSRSRTRSGVFFTLALDSTIRVGTDLAGRPLLYAPLVYNSGSSVSHWDTSATPNLLMEPFNTPGLSTVLTAPKDLTFPLLKDIGW